MKKDIHQLELDFSAAKENLLSAVHTFDTASTAWAHGVAEAAPLVSSVIYQETEFMRQTCHRLIGILTTTSGLPFHAAWVMAYHELFKSTGYHPIAAGKLTAHTVFLDRVAKDGKLLELQETIVEMLKDPKYAKKHNL